MGIEFESHLAEPEAVQAALREGRPLREAESVASAEVAAHLDPVSWLEALEEALDDVLGPGARLERDGMQVSAASFVVPDKWVARVAGLRGEDVHRVVERWADFLGESLRAGERPEHMLKDLKGLTDICRQAQRDGLAVLYLVNC